MRRGILLGSGFSYELGMPVAAELTEIFLSFFTRFNKQSFVTAINAANTDNPGRPTNRKALNAGVDLLYAYKAAEGQNYEELLGNILALGNKYDPNQTREEKQSNKDSYSRLYSILYGFIHKILTFYQLRSYQSVYRANLHWYSGLKYILSDEQTWVFTLNHDIYPRESATTRSAAQASLRISRIQMHGLSSHGSSLVTDPKTTRMYDRRNDEISLDEVEQVGI